MSIRKNLSRILLLGLLLVMLITSVGYAATSPQLASNNHTKSTLFQTDDTDQSITAIACNDSGESSGGGCGG